MSNSSTLAQPGYSSSSTAINRLDVYRWSRPIDYAQAYKVQRRLNALRIAGNIPDTLLILEHNPTLTAGKSGKLENLLVPIEELSRRGISLFFVDRGGDFTFHGPGQLVLYPVIDLTIQGKDVPKYVHNLEEVVIRTLADISISAGRDEKHIGVWVGKEKIAAIGVSIHRWVTMHGLALNVNINMENFSLINPCGITDKGVTSIERLLGPALSLEDVAASLVNNFKHIFKYSEVQPYYDIDRCEL